MSARVSVYFRAVAPTPKSEMNKTFVALRNFTKASMVLAIRVLECEQIL